MVPETFRDFSFCDRVLLSSFCSSSYTTIAKFQRCQKCSRFSLIILRPRHGILFWPYATLSSPRYPLPQLPASRSRSSSGKYAKLDLYGVVKWWSPKPPMTLVFAPAHRYTLGVRINPSANCQSNPLMVVVRHGFCPILLACLQRPT